MNKDLQQLHKSLRRACRQNEFYAIFDNQCGAFDGGCVHVAAALERIYGGNVEVVSDRWGRWQHAILHIGNDLYLDGNGVSTPERILRTWEKEWYVILPYIDDSPTLDELLDDQEPLGRDLIDTVEAYFRTHLPAINERQVAA